MPKTVLLADDSVTIQKVVGLSFAKEDIALVTTGSGDEALSRVRELHPDLVLADIVMPGKNGYEVCEAIRAEPDLQDIPVLLLTGVFEPFDEERARKAGFNGYITKPFEAQALVERVRELLANTSGDVELAAEGDAPTLLQARPLVEVESGALAALQQKMVAEPLSERHPQPLPRVSPADNDMFDEDSAFDLSEEPELDAGLAGKLSLPVLDSDDFEFDDLRLEEEQTELEASEIHAKAAFTAGVTTPVAGESPLDPDPENAFEIMTEPFREPTPSFPAINTAEEMEELVEIAPFGRADVSDACSAESTRQEPPSASAASVTPARERVHDTLEKIAWEAFADLPDRIVHQIVERVESIAWEVIPQLAETLIREEIRRLKGDPESH